MEVTTFSGADTMTFFDKEYVGTLMSYRLDSGNLTALFCLGKEAINILNKGGSWIDFDFVSVNEQGKKGLISGTCRPTDFQVESSIDELSTEIRINFYVKDITFKGFMGGTDKENQEITEHLHYDLLKDVKREGTHWSKL